MDIKKRGKWLITVLAIVCLVFPFVLNWILQIKAIVPVIGDSSTWLSFWPVYLSSIASFGMILITYLTLQHNIKQTKELRKQREEDDRARLVFSVIVYQTAFMLKIRNVGKRDVYNAVLSFNEDFLDELMEEKFEEPYRQLSSPFFIEAGTSRHLFIGFCQDVNDAWKNKKVVIKIKGSYNGSYTVDEEIDMSMFLDKTFMLVQGDLETTMGHIKKGLVVQNNFHKPIQVSLETIAKSLGKVESSLEVISEHISELSESRASDKDHEIQSECNSD